MDIFTRSGVILAPLSPPIVRGTRGVALHTNRGNQARRVNRGGEGGWPLGRLCVITPCLNEHCHVSISNRRQIRPPGYVSMDATSHHDGKFAVDFRPFNHRLNGSCY